MSEEKTKYCPYCGVQIEEKYLVCPNCGKQQPPIYGMKNIQVRPQKNPMLAAVLSFMLPGLGQIYLGRVVRGLCYLGLVFILSILPGPGLKFDLSLLELMFDAPFLVSVIISIVSTWDAYRLGKEINQQ